MTMQKVAELAGVSRAAVSAVLNNRWQEVRISDETRKRIEEVIEENHYIPHTIGQALVMRRSLTVGLILPTVGGSFTPMIVQGIEDVNEARGYGVLMMTTRSQPERQETILKFMLNRHIDGVIIEPSLQVGSSMRKRLIELELPIVEMMPRTDDTLPTSRFVCTDGMEVGRLGGRRLFQGGHRHIVWIGGTGFGINDGIQAAAGECSEPTRVEQWQPVTAQEIFDRWLAQRPRPTALFVFSDDLACQIMNIFIRNKIRIPEELALIGIDDMPIAAQAVVPLTTIRQPTYEQGVIAAEILFDLIEGRPGRDVICQPTLVPRQSA